MVVVGELYLDQVFVLRSANAITQDTGRLSLGLEIILVLEN